MTKLDLDAIEARCNAAMTGPWEAHSGKTDKGTPWNEVHSPCPCCGLIATTHPIAGADDAAFIAYARTDIPALIERVRELEAEREKGCEYCRERKPILNELGDLQIDDTDSTLWFIHQAAADDIYKDHTKIRFCPMCGKRLGVKQDDR